MRSVGETADAALQARLAAAVACPEDGRALLLDADNRRAGWLPLAEAVRSGRPYAVMAARHLIALDADSVDAGYLELAQALSDAGAPSVEVTSGGVGRRHLWLSLAPEVPAELRSQLEDAARARGVDVRSGARRIRPPLSPHRSGRRGVLLTPTTVEEACRRLEARGVTTAHLTAAVAALTASTAHAQGAAQVAARPLTAPLTTPLPAHLEELLRDGDTGRRYRSTSEALWAVELALANRGTSPADAAALIAASPLWQASSKAERPSGLAWLDADYARAVAQVAAQPRISSRPEAQVLLSQLEAAALRWRWQAGLGAHPRSLDKALAGVLRIARRAGVTSGLSLSVRSVSLEGSLGVSAAHRALRTLTAQGVLEVTERPSREMATRYRIALEHPLWQTATDTTAGDSAQPDADAWRHRGALGGAAWRAFALLEAEGSATAEELAGLYGAGVKHLRKLLGRLASAGLIRTEAGRWVPVTREERSRILAALDTGGVALWRERYETHRRGWELWLAGREAVRLAALERDRMATEAAQEVEAALWAAEEAARARGYAELAGVAA